MVNGLNAQIVQIDVGQTGQSVQSGWTEYSLAAANNVGPFTESFLIGSDSFDITFGTPSESFDITSRNAVSGTAVDDVLSDTFKQTGNDIVLTISGLDAGSYTWTGYHHDSNVSTVRDALDITVDGLLVVDDLQQTIGTAPATVATSAFGFTSDGATDIVIRLIDVDTVPTTSQIYLNGFEIAAVIPEPSTYSAMLALFVGALVVIRRRSK